MFVFETRVEWSWAFTFLTTSLPTPFVPLADSGGVIAFAPSGGPDTRQFQLVLNTTRLFNSSRDSFRLWLEVAIAGRVGSVRPLM